MKCGKGGGGTIANIFSFIEHKLLDGIHPTHKACVELMEKDMQVIGIQMDIENTREVEPDDYMEEGRCYRCQRRNTRGDVRINY